MLDMIDALLKMGIINNGMEKDFISTE